MDEREPSRFERRMARQERRAARRGFIPDNSTQPYPQNNFASVNLDQPGPGQPQANYTAYRSNPQPDGLARLRVYLATSTFTFLIVCAFLMVIWYFSGAGYFWPGWIIAFWVLALVIQLGNYFMRRNIG